MASVWISRFKTASVIASPLISVFIVHQNHFTAGRVTDMGEKIEAQLQAHTDSLEKVARIGKVTASRIRFMCNEAEDEVQLQYNERLAEDAKIKKHTK